MDAVIAFVNHQEMSVRKIPYLTSFVFMKAS